MWFPLLDDNLDFESSDVYKNLSNQYFWLIDEFLIVSKSDVFWNITYVNKMFCDISWFSKEELIWKPHSIVRHPDTPKEVFKDMWYTVKVKKETYTWIFKNLKKNWWHYWVKVLVKPILSVDGSIKEFISLRQDITKEKDYSEHMFQTIVENMGESVWIWDKYERTIYANPNFCNLLWYNLDEIIWEESYIFWDEESTRTVKNNNQLRQKGEKSKYEWVLVSKDWKKIPVLLSWAPLDSGWTVWIMTDLREIHSVKKLAEYQQAIEWSTILLKLWKNLEILYANNIFKKASKIKDEDIINVNFLDLIDNNPDIIDDIKLKIAENKVWRWELKIRASDLDYLSWVFCNIIPIFNKSWSVEEYLVLQHNITKEKKYEEKIAQDKNNIIQKLEDINKTKDEFLNIASHELRTPMTTVKWYISMILDWDAWSINDEVRGYLEKILSSSNRLLYLINDMLDVQKLESWLMQYDYTEFDVNNLLWQLYFDMRQLWSQKWQKILLNNDFESLYIRSDYNKLLQVLINLVWNAIKFTPNWWVIEISLKDISDNIVFVVKDNWIWIAQEDIWKIFDKFSQVKNSLTRDINWTWLWLPIVKSIVHNIWWLIYVSSELWKWTEFRIVFKKKDLLIK